MSQIERTQASVRTPFSAIQRLEGAAIGLASLVAFFVLSTDYWLLLALILPDLSMLGYALGPRKGALIYNLAHTYVVPVLLLGLAWFFAGWALPLLALWCAHIGLDRALGYGLKAPTGFTDTHLGTIGKAGH